MESGDYLLGMAKLVIGMASLIRSLHNKLDTPGVNILFYLRQHLHQA